MGKEGSKNCHKTLSKKITGKKRELKENKKFILFYNSRYYESDI
jgi:hypothetical protein